MNEKVVGYGLLTTGLLVILFSAISVYSVFTKRSAPVDLFNFPAIGISADTLFQGASLEQRQAMKQLNGGVTPQVELLSADMINKTSNILAHLFLMGFIASIGSRVATIGVKMVRPIVVKVNEAKSK